MNERNVDWLCAALMAANTEAGYPLRRDRDIWMAIAEALASQGVLVPSAMTDQEAFDIRPGVHPAMSSNYTMEYAAALRKELDRIAKGEPPA